MENLKSKNSLEFEFEGKSVEDAVKKAVAALKIHRKDLNIRVVSEEQKGLFGMAGAKLAHIIVSASKVQSDKSKKKA